MLKQNHRLFAAHTFASLNGAQFSARDYSRLKFGSDSVAMDFGYELADKFFGAHADALLAAHVVVIPSPYNHIKNAATVLTMHFIDRLNELLVEAHGRHVEMTTINRKVSYTNDYGFLPADQRRALIDNDTFYLPKGFLRRKLLVFIDDIRITGTHEDKLVEVLEKNRVSNDAFFLYFGNYTGERADVEAELNFAAVRTPTDFLEIAGEEHHHTIIRPIKYLLGLEHQHQVDGVLAGLTRKQIAAMYYGSMAEGYYRIPKYQPNFQRLVAAHKGQD